MSKRIDTIAALLRPGGARTERRVTSKKGVRTPRSAPAMMMLSRDIGPLIEQTAERLADWHQRRTGRKQLMGMDDRELKDLGISRCDAEREYRKPFWRR